MGVVGSDDPRSSGMASGAAASLPAAPVESGPTVLPWSCKCGRRWRGLSLAHCPTCHQSFSGVAAFDRHRYRSRCLNPGRLTDQQGNRILHSCAGSGGPVWTFRAPTPHPKISGPQIPDLREQT